KAMYVAGTLTIIAVAGALIIWGQSSKGPMGDQGPPGPQGPQGDAGPPSTTSGIRRHRRSAFGFWGGACRDTFTCPDASIVCGLAATVPGRNARPWHNHQHRGEADGDRAHGVRF